MMKSGWLILRFGLDLVAVALVALLLFLFWERRLQPAAGEPSGPSLSLPTSVPSTPTPAAWSTPVWLPAFSSPQIARQANLLTVIPERPNTAVLTYTVEEGDSLFAIAESFDLEPETLLWSNFDTLKDNPHLLKPAMVLNILPEDGVYHQWKEGDSLGKIAAEFKVNQDAILSYPGNHFDLAAVTRNPSAVEPGTWVIVPGGQRAIKDWGPPTISRSNPASAAYYGPGHCGKIASGAIGTGSFVWPTASRTISGYGYSGIHRAIDIGGSIGDAVFASDSGVVVYAGTTYSGYGNLIVIDHGNGYQTAYAHLNSFNVGCGQSVGKGQVIAGLGSTGNSTGPHLHFELSFSGTKPNPLGYLK
jgi:LysM repeat protein